MKKINFIVLTSLLLAMTGAHAENRPGAVAFTFGAGHEYFADKRDLRNTGLPYFGLAYDFNPCWGAEVVYGTFQTKFRGSIPYRRHINADFLLFNGVFHLPSETHFSPFVAIGAGITSLDPNRHDANNEGNVNAGVGFQYFIHPEIAFRFDVKDIYTIIGGKNDIFVGGGMSFVFG